MAEDFVASLIGRESFDGVGDVAHAMPMAMVPDFRGWPQRGRDRLMEWASAALQSLGPIDQPRTQAGFPLEREMGEYTFRLAAERDLLPGRARAGAVRRAP